MTTPRKMSEREKNIDMCSRQLRASVTCGVVLALSSVFMLNSMDDGEWMDSHKHIPARMTKALEAEPTLDRTELSAKLEDVANQQENSTRLNCMIFNVLAGCLILYRKRRMDNALLNGPR